MKFEIFLRFHNSRMESGKQLWKVFQWEILFAIRVCDSGRKTEKTEKKTEKNIKINTNQLKKHENTGEQYYSFFRNTSDTDRFLNSVKVLVNFSVNTQKRVRCISEKFMCLPYKLSISSISTGNFLQINFRS